MSENVTARKAESRIYAKKTDGNPIDIRGRKVGFIEVPAGMDGNELTFHGCFEGSQWFVVLDEKGQPVTHSTRWLARPLAAQEAQTLQPAPVVVPIPILEEYLEGIAFLIPVSNRPESADRVINFYLKE